VFDDVGCGCGEDGPSGCDEACGSTLENDECGICGGGGIPEFCGEELDSDGTFTGEYYVGSPEFSNLVLTSETEFISFDGNCSSFPDIETCNYFQVRWSGIIFADVEGEYNFRSVTDDGVRLYIDGELVIDHWYPQGATSRYGSIDLFVGNHDFVMEYFENGGGQEAHLYWTPPGAQESYVNASTSLYCDCDCNMLDECGVCGGDGVAQECGCGFPGEFEISEGQCDCEGNVVDECGLCAGEGVLDECGVCDGPGSIYECGCYEPDIECYDGEFECDYSNCNLPVPFTYVPFLTHSSTSNTFTIDLINPEVDIISPIMGDHSTCTSLLPSNWSPIIGDIISTSGLIKSIVKVFDVDECVRNGTYVNGTGRLQLL
jgi:hypothetical protein